MFQGTICGATVISHILDWRCERNIFIKQPKNTLNQHMADCTDINPDAFIRKGVP